MNLEQVATNISRECTVTVHDVKAVLSSLQEQIILALQDGKSVRFGDLGSLLYARHEFILMGASP